MLRRLFVSLSFALTLSIVGAGCAAPIDEGPIGAQRGNATAIEYGLIAALVAVVTIAGLTALGSSLDDAFSTTSDQVDSTVDAARDGAGLECLSTCEEDLSAALAECDSTECGDGAMGQYDECVNACPTEEPPEGYLMLALLFGEGDEGFAYTSESELVEAEAFVVPEQIPLVYGEMEEGQALLELRSPDELEMTCTYLAAGDVLEFDGCSEGLEPGESFETVWLSLGMSGQGSEMRAAAVELERAN